MAASNPSIALDSEVFISEVKEKPEIWRSRHPHRNNKLRVKKSWEDIRKKLYPGLAIDDLKRRWKNLKDAYRKELKRLPQSRPGVTPENFRSNWRYFDSLSFLKDEMILNNAKDNVEPSVLLTDQDQFFARRSQSPASQASSKSEEETEKPDTKRRDPRELREDFLKIEKKKMKILEEEIARSNEHMKSDNYHFLMSLLPEMDKLPPLQKMRLRTKISQAVLDEVSMSTYEAPQTYTDMQHITFQEDHLKTTTIVDNIKEETAINMYD